MTTGNILYESSSAPRQHKSVQFKWFTLNFHREVSHTDMLQLHFISCRGVSGTGGNMRGSSECCQSSAYFTVDRGGPMVLLLRKLYLYFTKDPEGVHYFPRGGGALNFFHGGWVQTLISLETHVRTCYFQGGGGQDPLSPS